MVQFAPCIWSYFGIYKIPEVGLYWNGSKIDKVSAAFKIELLFSAHINGGEKSWSVMRFLKQILPKLHFISIPWSEVHVTKLLDNF